MCVCDKDCFNCKFEDCINDELDQEDSAELDKLDEILIPRNERVRRLAG